MNLGKPDELKTDAVKMKLLLDAVINSQVALQILMEKGIATREEVVAWKEKIQNQPKYKASYEYAKQQSDLGDLYEKDPQAYLKAMLDAKLRGDK